MNFTVIIVTVIYFVLMIAIGLFFSKRIKNTGDYYVGGRNLPAIVAGFSFAATQMSGSTYMGAIGTAAQIGYNFMPGAIGSVMATYWAFPLLGAKMRRVAAKLKSLTLPDLFAARFGESAKVIKPLIAVIYIVGFIPMMVGQLKAAGNALQILAGIPYVLAVAIAMAGVFLYVYWGGMFAVAWTDLIQGLIMIVGMAIVIPTILSRVGGLVAMNAKFAAINPNLTTLKGMMPTVWVAGLCIMWGFFQIGGAPASVVRFMTVKNAKSVKSAMMWSLIFTAFIFFSYSIVGPACRVMFPNPDAFDLVFPMAVKELLPTVVSGIILAAILAAIMSTVDSDLLVVGSAAAKDLYTSLFNPKATEKQQLVVGRIVLFLVAVITGLIALHPPTAILWLVTMTFSLFASAFTAVIIAMFWWPGATGKGAVWSIIAGTVTCVVWYIIGFNLYHSLNMWPGGFFPPFVGVPVATLVLFVVSKLTPKPSEKSLKIFFN